jgi:ABC-type transport system substrate-binding protein
MKHIRGLFTALLFPMLLTIGVSSGAAAPEGQMTWALHFSPTPTWFDPAEISGTTASYNTLYALHDAVIRPSPGQPMAPSLAESWSASPDGLVYEFVLRKGASSTMVTRSASRTSSSPSSDTGASRTRPSKRRSLALKF